MSASHGARGPEQWDDRADVVVIGTGVAVCAATAAAVDAGALVILGPATLDTCGGPVIGPDARVLRPDGSAIPGLFGAGNCIASPTGQGYWGAGGTLGPAITFGFIAGQTAAASAPVVG